MPTDLDQLIQQATEAAAHARGVYDGQQAQAQAAERAGYARGYLDGLRAAQQLLAAAQRALAAEPIGDPPAE
jgi:hypothetical protein